MRAGTRQEATIGSRGANKIQPKSILPGGLLPGLLPDAVAQLNPRRCWVDSTQRECPGQGTETIRGCTTWNGPPGNPTRCRQGARAG